MLFRFRSLIVYLCFSILMLGIFTACTETTPEATPTEITQPEVVETEESAPSATYTPYPTYTPPPTQTPYPTYTPKPEPTATPEPTETPEPTATPEPTEAPAATPKPASPSTPLENTTSTSTETEGAEPVVNPPTNTNTGNVDTSNWALEVRPDPNPSPPIGVYVSGNQKFAGDQHRLAGIIRNEGDETYTGFSLIATFTMYIDEDEPSRRYGPVQVNCQCLILRPGQECPFILEVTSRNLRSVFFHPEAYSTERVSSFTDVTVTGSYVDAIGYVHLVGNVQNPNPFSIMNTTVNGVLRDANGAIVSMGTYMILETIPGYGSAAFDISIKHAPYSSYEVYAQAEQ
ncbi:MAG: hypothetical protein JXA33_20070 [Anaerolineae bacterium]|nr:hypothetical protein [Anaerolineae bacterium]